MAKPQRGRNAARSDRRFRSPVPIACFSRRPGLLNARAMRFSRRLLALPWMLLALLVQAGAPVEAARMAADMANPLAAMPICAPERSHAPGDQKAPADHRDHDCCTCAAPVVDAPPAAAPVPAARVAVVLGRPEIAAQASPRGPPRLRPNARGPPLNA
jgi:hypothetical protein